MKPLCSSFKWPRLQLQVARYSLCQNVPAKNKKPP